MENLPIRLTVRTNPKCKFCLGAGKSIHMKGIEIICSCVTEQLRIVTVDKDYGIPGADRYVPGEAEFVLETTLGRLIEREG